jgi:hypothetical protein
MTLDERESGGCSRNEERVGCGEFCQEIGFEAWVLTIR